MDKRRRTPYLAALLLAAALTLAACDGTLPAAPAQAPAEEPAKALAPVGEAPAPADETVMISLGSALQVFELVGPAESLGAELLDRRRHHLHHRAGHGDRRQLGRRRFRPRRAGIAGRWTIGGPPDPPGLRR